MPFRQTISRFLSDDAGAVTVDYVVLTGAIIGIGMIMIQAVAPSSAGITENVGSRYAAPRITVVGTGGEDGGLSGSGGTDTGVTVEVTL
jgi:Flp pilus assembly pilin Flp